MVTTIEKSMNGSPGSIIDIGISRLMVSNLLLDERQIVNALSKPNLMFWVVAEI
jgi:hypothetical protein